MHLDHEKLDVYGAALDFAAWAYELCRDLSGMDRSTRDQLLRASQSIALNIAEGCGKIPSADRGRFLQIAGGSARECGAILDILNRCGRLDREGVRNGKDLLVRIVAMLTRMIERGSQVREGEVEYVDVNGKQSEQAVGYGYVNVDVDGNGKQSEQAVGYVDVDVNGKKSEDTGDAHQRAPASYCLTQKS